jgi:aryl-alcohol dehydrogenase-like predicted oxidoreductase
MKMRAFGKTGMQVSEIGLGAWQLANPDWGANDKNEARNIISRSLEAGCNFFDTAPAYGRGLSETLLGEVLAPARKQIVICSKFGHSPDWVTDFSPAAIRPSLEGSLRRLQTDYVDILLLHNPPREMMDGRRPRQGTPWPADHHLEDLPDLAPTDDHAAPSYAEKTGQFF